MDAAERFTGGTTSSGRRTPASHEVLSRIVRIACRIAAADEAVVLVRDEHDPRALTRVAEHCTRPVQTQHGDDDSTLKQALATGLPATAHAGGRLRAAVPLMWGGKVRGALAASGAGSTRRFGRPELDSLRELAELASTALEESEERARLEEIVDAGVAALVRAVDMRDDYTGRHSQSVGELACSVGARLGLDGMELWLLDLAAQLHDVGKIGVPDAILNKRGPLVEEEWELMRRHPELGAEVLAKVPGLEPVAPLVRAHHERWDGSGYPDGLCGQEIPLAARVIAVCDAFQAMTAERPYRGALSAECALAQITAGSGTQFDPEIVQALQGADADAA